MPLLAGVTFDLLILGSV